MKKRITMAMLAVLTTAISSSFLLAQDRSDTLKVKALTQNPHGAISIACDVCHATGEWKITRKDMAFDHNTQTGFPLEGQHRSGDCKACHANNQFAGSKTECYQCHNDIHKGQLGKQCDQCHTSKSWQPFNFKVQHDLTRFPLTGKHATTDCQSCHKNQQQNEFKGVTTVCSGCHLADYNSSVNPNHRLHNIPIACESCHTPQGWSPARIIDHVQFGFELTLGHSNISCAVCHSNGNYTITSECYSCHKNDYDQSNDPKHLTGHYSTDCLECHTTSPGWSPAKFDHAVTAFPLTGAHVTEQNKCASCHANGFTNTSKLCNACHANDFDQANDPNHVSGNYSRSCEQCHTTNPGWVPATFDHNTSRFPLTGGHLVVQDQCQKCHSTGYNNTPLTCYGCHQQDYLNTTAPAHVAGNFSTNCEQCHSTNPGWKPATFDHGSTSFPLTGAHLSVQNQCLACHASGFTNTPTDCYACHQQDFANTTNPNHLTGNYSTNCAVCHSTNPGWQPVVYNHNLTNFPLTGAHLAIQNQCIACHSSGYVGTPSTCYSCHLTAYNGSTNPSHQSLAFPTNCEQCHTTNIGWKPSTFNHNTTQFPLTGAHLPVATQCAQCHTTSLSGTSTACYSCHQAAYSNTTNPNHVTNNFPTDCSLCHNTNLGWTPATFDHNATAFPLTGAHLTVATQCSSCHASGYVNTPTNCYACHQTDYNNAASPNHATNNFPTNCTQCHTTNAGWKPSTFDHNATQFPLTGAHLAIGNQCISCHSSGYVNIPTSCISCHQTDYDQAAAPNHAALSFPTTCQIGCHNTTGWTPSIFNHGTYTTYTLAGAHQAIASQCSKCHSGNLTSASTACYSCHQNDYNNSTKPNHAGSGFSHECQTCHNQNVWIPWTVNHDAQYFPINTGKHGGLWTGCGGGSANGAGCHTNDSDWRQYSCIHCHEHNITDTNDHHKEIKDYVYTSQACFTCHPHGTTGAGKLKKYIR